MNCVWPNATACQLFILGKVSREVRIVVRFHKMSPVNKPDYQDSYLMLKYDWVAIVFVQGNGVDKAVNILSTDWSGSVTDTQVGVWGAAVAHCGWD